MADVGSDAGTDSHKNAQLLLSPEETSRRGDGDAKGSRAMPFRTNFEKILLVVVVVLVIICVTVIAHLVVEKNKADSSNAGETDNVMACSYSDEAKRVGLAEFVKKVQRTYYEYNKYDLVRPPGMTLEEFIADSKGWGIENFGMRYRPLNATPAYLREKTDVALSLYEEIKKKTIDENKLKAREAKAVQQVKFYLRTTFGFPYDQNFYDGDWLLGPNHFCRQPLCYMGYSISAYASIRLGNLSELEDFLRRIRMTAETLKQYQLNMKLGVKTGMVRSVFACESGANAFKHKFQKLSRNNDPKEVLNEWFVEKIRNDSFTKGISKADQESWLKSKGQNISKAIDDGLVEGIGEPIVAFIEYLDKEHIRHCLPQDLSSGLAGLPVDYVYLDGNRTEERTTKTLPLTGQALNGKNAYKNILPYFTTSDITPEEINKMGKEKLDALYSQAIAIAKNVTGESDTDTAIREFQKRLNDSRQFFNSEPFPANESDTAAHKNCSDIESAKLHCPKRWEAIITWSAYARETLGMLAPKLIPLFYHTGEKITVPNCPLEMRPDFNPSSGAQSFDAAGSSCAQAAYYNLPFFLNNFGPKFAEWSVTAHEGWPGHHTQVQGHLEYFLNQCDDALTWLDDSTSSTFFSEGWALYAESPVIAQDTDTYDNQPMKKYGMLQWQIWRALRLIVDTGLHYRGMNRTTALGLFAKYAWDETDLSQKEVTRYQGTPGQATAYMLGQQKLVELRKYCKSKLGDKFKIQDFHYQVLSQGSAPESYLDKHVKKYVACTLGDLDDKVCGVILNQPKKRKNAPRSDLELELRRQPPMPSRAHYV